MTLHVILMNNDRLQRSIDNAVFAVLYQNPIAISNCMCIDENVLSMRKSFRIIFPNTEN